MANRLLARRGRVCLLVPMCPRIEPCAVHSQPALHSQGSRLGVGTLLHTSTRLPIPCPRLPRSCLRRRSAWRASPMPRWLPCWSSTPKSASTTCFAGLLVCGEVPAVCFSGGSMARVCKTGLPPLLWGVAACPQREACCPYAPGSAMTDKRQSAADFSRDRSACAAGASPPLPQLLPTHIPHHVLRSPPSLF